MKDVWRSVILIAAAVMATTPCPAVAAPRTLNVQVREGCIRAGPSALSAMVARVSYGETLAVLEEQGSWFKVKKQDSDVSGWMPKTSLTPRKVKLSAGEDDAKVSASGGELALAGKGFNSKVESEFKAKNKNLNFAAVDAMEKIKVSTQAMQAFLKDGGLAPQATEPQQ